MVGEDVGVTHHSEGALNSPLLVAQVEDEDGERDVIQTLVILMVAEETGEQSEFTALSMELEGEDEFTDIPAVWSTERSLRRRR